MDSNTNALTDKLREACALLVATGEQHWATWMSQSLSEIENGNLAGVDKLLSAYGGMGSFNDLILTSFDGHLLDDAGYRRWNHQLDSLRSELYALATEIARQ
ncbi:MAG: hypothetical protein KGQ60_09465 [Planctomycetes bacterium]|nr:hypothetical protein [Planctomycetota bacterium]